MESRNDDEDEEDSNLIEQHLNISSNNSMNGENKQAERDDLESKIKKIGVNLKSIQENLHEVVNSIQTLESTK